MRRLLKGSILVLALGALMAAPALSTTLMQMSLGDLTQRAERVFRGTVLDTREGTVELGGGSIPVTTYVIRVDESFKGDFPVIKDMQIAEMTMLGKMAPKQAGNARFSGGLPEMPRMEIGKSYLLFASPPSGAGLSTTIGLGQGCFHISTDDNREIAVNEFDNLGLFRGHKGALSSSVQASGPMSYSSLAGAVRAELAAQGE